MAVARLDRQGTKARREKNFHAISCRYFFIKKTRLSSPVFFSVQKWCTPPLHSPRLWALRPSERIANPEAEWPFRLRCTPFLPLLSSEGFSPSPSAPFPWGRGNAAQSDDFVSLGAWCCPILGTPFDLLFVVHHFRLYTRKQEELLCMCRFLLYGCFSVTGRTSKKYNTRC